MSSIVAEVGSQFVDRQCSCASWLGSVTVTLSVLYRRMSGAMLAIGVEGRFGSRPCLGHCYSAILRLPRLASGALAVAESVLASLYGSVCTIKVDGVDIIFRAS